MGRVAPRLAAGGHLHRQQGQRGVRHVGWGTKSNASCPEHCRQHLRCPWAPLQQEADLRSICIRLHAISASASSPQIPCSRWPRFGSTLVHPVMGLRCNNFQALVAPHPPEGESTITLDQQRYAVPHLGLQQWCPHCKNRVCTLNTASWAHHTTQARSSNSVCPITRDL